MYAICKDINCGKWGEIPKGFDEHRHFAKCECGSFMALMRIHPHNAAYRDSAKIEIKFVSQDQS